MRVTFRILAASIILISGGFLLWESRSVAEMPSLTGEFSDAFDQFAASPYLQSLWSETCVFSLEEKNVVMIAAVDAQEKQPTLRCQWRHVPTGVVDNVGIEIPEAATDIRAEWIQCGTDDAFAEDVQSAVHNPGSRLVHLGRAPLESVTLPYVLVAKCHYWDEKYCDEYKDSSLCQLKNADEILSVAYAVLDSETGTVYW